MTRERKVEQATRELANALIVETLGQTVELTRVEDGWAADFEGVVVVFKAVVKAEGFDVADSAAAYAEKVAKAKERADKAAKREAEKAAKELEKKAKAEQGE